MKRILFIIALAVSFLAARAQGGQVAVLYHGDEFTTFYSTDAFKNAMTQAVDGDVLTLSPGSYEADKFKITKAVTIRGAGIGAVDAASDGANLLTSISGSIEVDVPVSEDGYTLSIEGIDFKDFVSISGALDAVFSKCRFSWLHEPGGSTGIKAINLTLFHCIISSLESLIHGVNIYNCVVEKTSSGIGKISYTNSIVLIKPSDGHNGSNNGPQVYHNCIFISEDKTTINRNVSAYNCVWVGVHVDAGAYEGDNAKPERQNKVVPEGTEIFEEGKLYVLNEEGRKYLGSDGTQVGLYGSNLPFSTKTSYPQIKKLTVAPESTSDGKLKIEFEIE